LSGKAPRKIASDRLVNDIAAIGDGIGLLFGWVVLDQGSTLVLHLSKIHGSEHRPAAAPRISRHDPNPEIV